ncbi:MAG: chromosomal replication initiator protein DnaA [Candidatus Liptonbacteria bacterium CG11_big_fil_rev_8_21_14_0_20_35_14]|uniref:Chromosomal replication initiator protein DnaA n=1 Tax=Candidatus Liptonbacteria bacterium CG11_big_fil_rev_8_21_14_0_20_35_14 TaxID=1974634 RepID=A0A2H0N7Y4_9BACT|nr:MAG: chromosomal replication initiator protein DnaA [Candidatus Liptonbacteria bacterium CG11_big_fil_rev_8_21_14_0_20_35_14]
MEELDNIWQSVLSEMEIQLSHANFHTWMKNSKLINKDNNGMFIIALPNNFCKEWVENKYYKNILSVLRNMDSNARKIEFIVQGSIFKGNYTVDTKKTPRILSQMVFPEFKIDPNTNLNPRYTFKNFIVGSSNELAFAAGQAIVKSVGTKYNPFFVYGGVGLGKTHLIQSIGNEILRQYGSNVRVKYVSSEKFTSDVVWAIKNNRMEDIKSRYRDVDVLIIDDIQFIGGKEKTEEEFFHTFNTLYSLNKQIIISSDRVPAALPTLHDRLRSRFEGGMIIDIVYPDYEMRVAIIKTKLQECQHNLDETVIDLIAKKMSKNIREIEGIINKIIFIKESKGVEINESHIEDVITKNNQHNSNISPNKIIKTVADFFEISIVDLVGKSRKKEIVEPRQITMFLLRDILSMSYPFIGDKVGKRDHTTAIHACEKINTNINKDINLSQKVGLIKESIFKE